jgi:hypothetical protein
MDGHVEGSGEGGVHHGGPGSDFYIFLITCGRIYVRRWRWSDEHCCPDAGLLGLILPQMDMRKEAVVAVACTVVQPSSFLPNDRQMEIAWREMAIAMRTISSPELKGLAT